MKLGRLPPRHDPRTLRLARYLGPSLPPAPASKDWAAASRMSHWGMMLNDALGDCTVAAAGHLIQLWTALAPPHAVRTVPDSQILAAYEAVGGYRPGEPATDGGAVMLDVLNYWRKAGVGGDRLGAFAALSVADTAEVKQAVNLFGGVYAGLSLPLSARAQVGSVWSVPPGGPTGEGAPGGWGGHCVPVVGYDSAGLVCLTWGQRQRLDWAFWGAYADEAYAALSPDWLAGVRAPNGFAAATLQADLLAVTGALPHRLADEAVRRISFAKVLDILAQFGPQAIDVIRHILDALGAAA